MKARDIFSIIFLTGILGIVLALGNALSSFKPSKVVNNFLDSFGKNKVEVTGDLKDQTVKTEIKTEEEKEDPHILFTNSKGSKHKIYVEIADTPQERAYGLMNRTSLGKDRGMLFVFDDEFPHDFWMKDTLVALDVIHLSSNQVVEIIENMQPCPGGTKYTICPNYPASLPSKYSLEVNAGTAEKFGLQPGDKVDLKLE